MLITLLLLGVVIGFYPAIPKSKLNPFEDEVVVLSCNNIFNFIKLFEYVHLDLLLFQKTVKPYVLATFL